MIPRAPTPFNDPASLLAHLPRLVSLVDIADDNCLCCSAPLHRIGEEVSERLDVVPVQFRVRAC